MSYARKAGGTEPGDVLLVALIENGYVDPNSDHLCIHDCVSLLKCIRRVCLFVYTV